MTRRWVEAIAAAFSVICLTWAFGNVAIATAVTVVLMAAGRVSPEGCRRRRGSDAEPSAPRPSAPRPSSG
jgi:hypothetical protein